MADRKTNAGERIPSNNADNIERHKESRVWGVHGPQPRDKSDYDNTLESVALHQGFAKSPTDPPLPKIVSRDSNQPRQRCPVPRDSPLDVYGPAIYHVFFLEGGIRS